MRLGLGETRSPIKLILAAADETQKLIDELHLRDPENETFEQMGFLDGREIINEYIDHHEWGLGLEHLLYMIHEADIKSPPDVLCELHQLAIQYGLPNGDPK